MFDIPDGLRVQTCPWCETEIYVFGSVGEVDYVIERNGNVHHNCAADSGIRFEPWLLKIRAELTMYDTLLLQATGENYQLMWGDYAEEDFTEQIY